jgi:hypothetical protein
VVTSLGTVDHEVYRTSGIAAVPAGHSIHSCSPSLFHISIFDLISISNSNSNLKEPGGHCLQVFEEDMVKPGSQEADE